MSELAESYRRWFEYEKDSHEKVLGSLRSVPEALRGTAPNQQALTLFAHIVAARRLWLHRFGVAIEGPRDFFPQDVNLDELCDLLNETQTAWDAYLEGLDDAELARVFEYHSLEGPGFRNTVEDILTQLFGHSWYHRGQIAQLIRSIGCEPAVTDFVFWTREPLEERL